MLCRIEDARVAVGAARGRARKMQLLAADGTAHFAAGRAAAAVESGRVAESG